MIAARPMGSPMIATRTRCLSICLCSRRVLFHVRGGLLPPPRAEPPVAGCEIAQCLLELRPAEIRPQHLGEIELRIRRLPQQEVGETPLSGGPDHKVWVTHQRRIEMSGDVLLR